MASLIGHPLLRVADLQVDPALDEIRKDGQDDQGRAEDDAAAAVPCRTRWRSAKRGGSCWIGYAERDVVVSHDSVYAAVAALRRTLGDDPKNPRYIANVVRRGYRLIAPVSQWVDPPVESAADAASPLPEKPSIAVLPFVNLSGDPAEDYFSDGITEDVISELSRWRRLVVRSRSASFRYRGAAVDMKRIASELGIRFLVDEQR